jgi:hypothetical protein
MSFLRQRKSVSRASLIIVLLASSIGLSILPAVTAASSGSSAGPSMLPSTTFVPAPPTGSKGPDDITMLATKGVNGGNPLVWTNYQNGINPDGTPGVAGGPTMSTIAGYDPSTGALVLSIKIAGKCDGLTADQKMGVLIATVNEDSNSAIDLIYPGIGAVASYTYSPDPAVAGNGGTDSVAVIDGQVYLTHSNPNDVTQPTQYSVTFDRSTPTLTAHLTPVFFDNNMATNAVTGATTTLALTDPDTSSVMPRDAPRFAGDLVTIAQADGQVIFASDLQHTPKLTVLGVTDNKVGKMPPLDGFAVATSDHGTLYAVDAKASVIYALDTTGWAAGTVFVGEPSDQGNPIVGVLNLSTGVVTPLGNALVSPKGLLFVPAGGEGDNSGEGGDILGGLLG